MEMFGDFAINLTELRYIRVYLIKRLLSSGSSSLKFETQQIYKTDKFVCSNIINFKMGSSYLIYLSILAISVPSIVVRK